MMRTQIWNLIGYRRRKVMSMISVLFGHDLDIFKRNLWKLVSIFNFYDTIFSSANCLNLLQKI